MFKQITSTLRTPIQRRSFHRATISQGKVLVALYPDPVTGYPPKYARDSIPTITHYADGQTVPSPKSIDFTPGQLLGCVSGELGLRKFVESQGHELIVTSDKDGSGCEMEKHLKDAIVVISQPFYPFYLTAERQKMAPNLKLALTAGIGSDHVDLEAAMKNKIDVLEVTFCNSISVSEHVVMQILALVRNYMPSYKVCLFHHILLTLQLKFVCA
jgi:formate dehydrogenase